MDNVEKQSKREGRSEKILNLFIDLTNDFFAEELDGLERNKGVLALKLEDIYLEVENKKVELNRALEEKAPYDKIQLLFLEFQQKNLVLKDLEMNLTALQIAIDRKTIRRF